MLKSFFSLGVREEERGGLNVLDPAGYSARSSRLLQDRLRGVVSSIVLVAWDRWTGLLGYEFGRLCCELPGWARFFHVCFVRTFGSSVVLVCCLLWGGLCGVGF